MAPITTADLQRLDALAAERKIALATNAPMAPLTTLRVGGSADRLVEVQTRDFCDKSVGAVLGYPVKYDFAYTWFHEAEWEVGNRRSICWAKTDR